VEAFFLALLALGLTAALRAWRFRRPGRVAALYLTGAGALRLTLEFFRDDFRGDIPIFGLPPTTLAAGLSLVLGLVCLLLLFRARTRWKHGPQAEAGGQKI